MRNNQLSKIQDVRVDQLLGQRMLSVGDIAIKTSGETSRLEMDSIERPQSIAREIIMDALRPYPWPGNIRELRNVIERAVILSEGSTLQVPLGAAPGPAAAGPPTLAAAEREQILAALAQTGWHIRGPAGAAHVLGLTSTTIESRIKKLGLQHPR